MAEIRRFPFVRHLRSTQTSWVRHTVAGRARHAGAGAAFWFRPLSATLSEVPLDDRELPLLVHTRTSDHQDVAVQGTLTFRFVDPEAAAARIDLSIDAATGDWVGEPLEAVASLLVELAAQHAVSSVARRSLAETLVDGIDVVRAQIWAGLQGEPRLEGTGIAVLGVRVVNLSLERDVERALKTPERERIQGEADRAGFARRAQAVDQERAIAENELANQIELARREEDLVARRGANERLRATERAASGRIEAESGAERVRLEAAAKAEADRLVGAAAVETQQAQYAVLSAAGPQLISALAMRDLAEAVAGIDQLTVTPDVLTQLVGQLGRRPA